MTTTTALTEKLEYAKDFCETHKYRWTEPRERVLAALLSHNEPLGAYQILELLSSKQERLKPPTVYRAIEFWQKHGFVHRIESMNAYLSCCQHNHHQNFCVFICDQCQQATELELGRLPASITTSIKKKSLVINKSVLEIFGRCAKCH